LADDGPTPASGEAHSERRCPVVAREACRQARDPRIQSVLRLREYYQDPNESRAHDVLPAAFTAVRNVAGEVLVVRRINNGDWELPGGRIEVGEAAVQA
jgi:NUDIX domain